MGTNRNDTDIDRLDALGFAKGEDDDDERDDTPAPDAAKARKAMVDDIKNGWKGKPKKGSKPAVQSLAPMQPRPVRQGPPPRKPTRGKRVSPEQCTFMRAAGDHGDPDYDPAADDSEEMAFGTMMVGLSGWLQCVGCGDPRPSTGGCVTTPEGRRYVYGLCPRCSSASKDEAHFAPQEARVRGRTVALPFSAAAPMKGRIGARIDAELARFIAAGEPVPE